ncbi:hypothetical protein PGT21_010727 [Puccinia graminis f. sp. tritici]|uniref:G-patch domain-containing protein n=1 Tax=Puccinia graminis f. sp. tritici TaxID=56615 RepID=A0A5B0ML52_PUCGR|nr:hypothetical protein PGT21_010727 [Puccinia graminis f. sp. tritici]KAA1111254.1 hypothetical protein PGTUg99_002374 [Puccinia graminis f. sp. tritici]
MGPCRSNSSNSTRAKPVNLHDGQEADEEEEDFMSDKFLKQITETSTENKTYSEKRKRRLIDASTNHQKRSRVQREIEAREEGLSRNLIQANVVQEEKAPPESHSKAFQMMLKMGFQPGNSLGASASNGSNEPINIVPRSGRAGIGIAPKPVSAAKLPRLLFSVEGKMDLTEEETAQREAFLATSRTRFDGRKVDAILGRACRTCEELDRRRGLESNIFWIIKPSPQDESREDAHLTRLDRLVSLDCQNDPDNILEDLEDEEKQNWLALDPSTRLSCTLGYLREEYFYCIWCGCQYESLEELNKECPGEEEDDH